jgi:hypothetical protein
MSWGAKAEVIGPESLLEAVQSEVSRMGKHYSTLAENKKNHEYRDRCFYSTPEIH